MATATTPEQVHARFLSALEQVGPAKVLAQVGHGGPSTEKEFIKGLRSGDERARLVMVERLPRARNPKLACELALAGISPSPVQHPSRSHA